MLLSVSIRTMAQSDMVQVAIAEIRKANATKQRSDSALAAGFLLQQKLRNYQDSIRLYQDSTQFWKQVAELQTRRKKGWRKAALIEGGILVAENAIIGLLLKK